MFYLLNILQSFIVIILFYGKQILIWSWVQEYYSLKI